MDCRNVGGRADSILKKREEIFVLTHTCVLPHITLVVVRVFWSGWPAFQDRPCTYVGQRGGSTHAVLSRNAYAQQAANRGLSNEV